MSTESSDLLKLDLEKAQLMLDDARRIYDELSKLNAKGAATYDGVKSAELKVRVLDIEVKELQLKVAGAKSCFCPIHGSTNMAYEKAMLECGIPAEHHEIMSNADATLGANGQLIQEIIALFRKYGPVVLTIIPQIIALLTSGGNWLTILKQIATMIEALLNPPAPAPVPVPPVAVDPSPAPTEEPVPEPST